MHKTLGMIKISDCGVAVKNLCLYLKLFTSPYFALYVAKCGSCLKPCETCVMLGATILAILA